VWRGQPPLCMTGSRVGSQLSSAQAQPLREGQINNACLRGPMRPGHYFDCGEPLDRSSACSAKRSYSFATLSTACLACSFVRRSASVRFSLARSRQCSGSLIKEAGMSTRLVLPRKGRPNLLAQQIRNAEANARADDRLNDTKRQIGNIQIRQYQTSQRQDQAATNHEGAKRLQDD